MVMNRTISIGCCLLLWLAVSLCAAQTIPAVNAVALDGSRVVLPNPGAQQVLILTLGFSHSSADGCESWNKRIAADYGADARVAYYQIPNLEGAPRIVIPMILHGMRRNVPAAAHAHFVPVYDHEAEWKTLVNFSGADDAYVRGGYGGRAGGLAGAWAVVGGGLRGVEEECGGVGEIQPTSPLPSPAFSIVRKSLLRRLRRRRQPFRKIDRG
jgi:hypothetical protein